jgi:predicted amidohydrolase
MLLMSDVLPSASAQQPATDGEPSSVRVAAISFVPEKFDLEGNADRLERFFRQAHEGGAKIAVAPEGALEGYVVNEIIAGKAAAEQMRQVAIPIDHAVIQRFQRLASELQMCLVFGFAEDIDGDVFNSAVFVDHGGRICGKHHKMRFAEGYHPSWWFNRLGRESRAFDTPYGRCGMMICNDRWEPRLARIPVLDGARFLVIPSYGFTGASQDDAVLKRGQENGVPVIEANVGVTLVVNDGKIVAVDRVREGITFGQITIPPTTPPQPQERDKVQQEYLQWRELAMVSQYEETLTRLEREKSSAPSLSKLTRGITGVTKGSLDLSAPRQLPSGQEGVYQLGAPFQLSATEAAMFVNIRRATVSANDLEMGSDLVIFDDVNAISADTAVPLIRGEEMDHPDTGQRIILGTYPFFGGFVPVGAKLADGSPHPHAGSGFAVCHQRAFAADGKSNYLALEKPFERRVLQEYQYDGATFRIVRHEVVEEDQFIPGHLFSQMSVGNAIPAGTDLLVAVSTKAPAPDGEDPEAVVGFVHGLVSGVARWRRGTDGHWSVVAYRPVAGSEGTCEPSLVQDVDGRLLFSARGTYTMGNNQALMVWGSADDGIGWEKLIHEKGLRNSAPVSINRAADGTPYLAANPHYFPSGRVFQHREVLALWPLTPDRRSVMSPIVIRDSADFGPGPYSHPWWVDHPIGYTVRLADGKLHHVLAYRVLGNHEAIYDAPPAPQTGCYVEEVHSVNEPLPIWRF